MHSTHTLAKALVLTTLLALTSTLCMAKPSGAHGKKPSARASTKMSERPRVKVQKAPRAPVMYKSSERVRLSAKDSACLTRNIYHEARGGPYAGQLAVAQITWNRFESRQWGPSLCNVVYAPAQFSWTADRRKRNKSPTQNADWLASRQIVQDYSQGLSVARLDDATYFHTVQLKKPYWTKKLKRRMAIGNHVFYE